MLDALTKYRIFIHSKPEAHQHFLEKKYEEHLHAKKRDMQHRLETNFPYPVSQLFFTYQHELDFHRKFQLTLQLYEVAIKYACIVVLSGYLLNRDQSETISSHLIRRFPRPSLGDWSNRLELLFKHSQGLDKLLHPMTPQQIVDARANYLEDTGIKKNLSQAIATIVSLRNTNTGHGALRSMYEYKLMVEDEMHRLYSFFDRLDFLSHGNSFLVLASEYDEFGEGDKYKIRIFKGLQINDSDLETSNRLSEGQRDTIVRYIYFQNTFTNIIVNLYPFISYMFCEECKRERFFFYNSRKSDTVISYLSYECGHASEKDNALHFKKRFQTSNIQW